MTNKDLFYFTGRCLALDEKPEFKKEILYKCENDLINWNEFIFLCSNQLVLPAIYLKFKKHHLIEFIPIEVAEHLQEIYELNTARNKNILQQIKEITKILNANDVDVVLLKGAANLLDKLYPDVGERILGDIDFLVHETKFLKAAKILEKEGYSVISRFTYSKIEDVVHYPRLAHPNFEAPVEIHRIPVVRKYLKWFNSEMINEDKKIITTEKGEPEYCVPSDCHKIIHNFIHSQLSHKGFLYGFITLRDIYDLLLLSKRTPIDSVLSKIKKRRMAKAYFALSDSVLGANKTLFSKRNFTYFTQACRYKLKLNFLAFYHLNRTVIFILQKVTYYIGRLLAYIFSAKERKAFVGRLRDPEWFHNHISSYTEFFNFNGGMKK